ncbi:MAG: hypothetical protein ACLTON_00640 [Christensenellales bacterium]|nr:MAG TPA: protein of unknown function (DUF5105) [Caudoviricetes sp.]
MKKFLIVIIIVIAVALVGVGGYFGYLQLVKNSALQSIDERFTNIKEGNISELEKYTSIDESTSSSDKEEEEWLMKLMLKNLNYEVVSAKPKFNECEVELKVTNKNVGSAFEKMFSKLLTLSFSTDLEDMSESQLNDKLNEEFEKIYDSDDVKTETNNITVTLKREDGTWNLSGDKDEITNALLPGYSDISSELNNISE